jgi:hypothetical protein
VKNKKIKLDVGSYTIVDAIKKSLEGVKEIEMMKMEITKTITTQMFQSEETSRKLIVQGQLQMATLFVEIKSLKIFEDDNYMHFELNHGH